MRLVLRLTPFVLFVFATASASAAAAAAASATSCLPVVTGAWIRMTPVMPMGAGFFSIRNPCRGDVVLSGVSSKRFGDVSMHETRVEGGMSRMRSLGRVLLRPGERVDFRAGGRHLMLMAPDARAVPGTRVRVELRLADGRTVPVDFDVRSAAP